jgi:hypothetical protein
MGLDLHYIPAAYLQQYFVDKDTALPLAGGIVTFYEDSSRTTLKPMYQISGIPPNYTYTPLANPMILSSVGTFEDGSGNDIVPYFYPYDLLGNTDLYYITVESADSILQFTREGQPNVGVETTAMTDVKNYIENGQFYLHDDIIATSTNDYGEITQEDTDIAPGLWQFNRSSTSTASDFVTFEEFTSWTTDPAGNPQWSVKLRCIIPDLTDIFKRLNYRLNSYNVNTFSSDTQQYTFSFAAQSNISAATVTFSVFKNYGSGGSADTDDVKATFVILPGYHIYTTSFTFNNNNGKILGDGNHTSLHINLPTDNVFDINFTNFLLAQGDITVNDYPVTTNNEFNYRSMYANMQFATDGSDYYLPLVKTPQGLIVDLSGIGEIKTSVNLATYNGWQICDGTQLRTEDYWSCGVPNSRLFNILYDSAARITRYGTGSSYVSAYTDATNSGNALLITTNAAGTVTNTSDGAIPTGFDFYVAHTGSSGYEVKAYTRSSNIFYLVTDQNAVYISGQDWKYVQYHDYSPIPMPTGFTKTMLYVGTYDTPAIERNTVTAGGAPLAGTYGVFQIIPLANKTDATAWGYWWYTVDGSGSDPAPSDRTYLYSVRINIRSTDTVRIVNETTRMSLNGWHVSHIEAKAGSTVTAGSYFNFSTLTTSYYVWYKVDGVGSDPAVVGKTGIEVDILSTDTSLTVSQKTQIAINSVYYAVPNYEGMFLRGYDPNSTVDEGSGIRWSLVPGIYGPSAGTSQFTTNKVHHHNIWKQSGGENTGTLAPTVEGIDSQYNMMLERNLGADHTELPAELDDSYEARPPNTVVYYYIKY